MNNGPNFGSLIIIGGVAGISAFGLYLGYKEIFERGKSKPKKDLNDVLSSLEDNGFDAERTLKEHKEKKKRYDKQERTKRRTDSEISLIENKNAEKKDSDKKKSEKNDSEKKKSEKNDSDKKKSVEKEVEEKLEKEPKATIINMEKSDLPKVMDKKKASSNEEVESLVGIPVTEGINAQLLLENDTIRTIDREIPKDSKKKKGKKKKSKSKSKEI